jgi:hypothetical protein
MNISIKKRVSIHCNEKFIEMHGELWWSILYHSVSIKDSSLPLVNSVVGKMLIECLNNSKELTNDEWDARFGSDYQEYMNSTKEKEERDILTIKKYNYKSKNELYKNMMYCSVEIANCTIIISPWNHTKLDTWEGSGSSIQISSLSSPEIIGAAVRYAFSKCKGKGPYAKGAEIVTKALFPDGVPNSLEEYLESIDKDYKRWLISC